MQSCILKKFILAAVLIFCFGFLNSVFAQTSSGQYDFEYFGDSGSVKIIGEGNGYGPIPNAYLLADWYDDGFNYWQGYATEPSAGVLNDMYSFPCDFGFLFEFYDQSYDYFIGNANMFLTFDLRQEESAPGNPNTEAGGVLNPGEPWDVIYVFWDDTRISNGYEADPKISYQIYYGDNEFDENQEQQIGLRNSIIEFYEVIRSSGSDYVNYYTAWARIYETTNVIELYYWKNLSSTCYKIECSADVGIEWGAGNDDDHGDEPSSNPDGNPTCTPRPYNYDGFHEGPSDSQGRDGCLTCVGSCIPPFHYRFVPVSYPWNFNWPEHFDGLSGPEDRPEWWSLTNEKPRGSTWKWVSSGGTSPLNGAYMRADSDSTMEILTTRFLNFTGNFYPGLSFSYDFQNDNNNNVAEILMTIDGNPWIPVWSHQGSDSSDTVNISLPAASNRSHVQIGFKYKRTDPPDTLLALQDMNSQPTDWVSGGSNDEWERGIPGSVTVDAGVGPEYGADGPGDAFYGQDIDGEYENNSNSWLRTNGINCSGYEYVELQFDQWLGVERSAYDVAYIEISTDLSTWNTVYDNTHMDHHYNDTHWLSQKYNLSPYAANQNPVYVRWRLDADGGYRSCGWNIDNVAVVGRQSISGYFAIDELNFLREPTPTPTETPTFTPTITPTNTPIPTDTPTQTPTFTEVPTGVATNTHTPSPTYTIYVPPTNTPTLTPVTTDTPTPTPTDYVSPTPTHYLDCLAPTELTCNNPVMGIPSDFGTNNVENYSCLPGWFLDAQEIVYSFIVPEDGNYTAKIEVEGSGWLSLIMMDVCNENADCTSATFAINFDAFAGETKYFVVDGNYSAQEPFYIEIECDENSTIPTTTNLGLIIMLIVLGGILAGSVKKN